ncbi:isopeptide-forming domain-containing fimbrial protein [Agathobacter sp.]|uniref:isopeptide-forming domain-containing fimbrial protein n=1 Tax=Agathobacter sp. TaxID=2021311 RepID=UPI002A91E6BD|nr:isopeptide-forming domain-containing fimbrial protein [Agathobacter sp.]MDY5861633.1 isopeptide-forming domain-containing fimbrial protein [Agathobacter sp.]
MKTIKRSIALVLAMILALAMSVTVFAAPNADQNTFSLTLNKAVEGHTYEAYQILSGNLLEDKKTLVNIEWGEGINAEGQTALGGDAAEYAKTLAEMGNNSSELKEQAQIIGANLASASGSVTVTDPDAKNVISNLKPGYYLIKDKDNSLQGQESYTEFILHVTDDVDANVKADVPSVEKKVKDTNDTTGETTGWQDSADYDIGDDVPFQLTATLANNIESYETYSLKFNDTLSKGLDYNNDAVIKLGDKVVTDSFTPSYDATAKTLTFTCDNILAFGAKNSDKIVVEYTAKLNENAEIGAAGNPNTVYLDFSNNPNNGGEGDRGKTPEDKVIVFTYKLTVNKVDKENKPLTGAEFSLFKKVNGKDELVEVKKILSTNAEGTKFEFKGLDDGTYVLRETKTPDGYNSIEDQTFTISAKHDENSDDPKLTELTGDVTSGSIIDLGVMLEKGELSTDVVNNKGSVLPSTGGAGRVAIYVIGAILVLGGGIVLVTKKRVR